MAMFHSVVKKALDQSFDGSSVEAATGVLLREKMTDTKIHWMI